MKHHFLLTRRLLWVFLLIFWGVTSQAFAAVEGSASNNTCHSAQDLGAIVLPFILDGNLDGAVPDVDYFKITGTPGSAVTVDLQGIDSNKGTLIDPMLGIYNSQCDKTHVGFDSSPSRDDKIRVLFPDDGILILAATECCDSDFNIGGKGTYQMAIQSIVTAKSITVRLVDAFTGQAINESYYGALIAPDSIYTFIFGGVINKSDGMGQPLLPGNYSVELRPEFFTEYEPPAPVSFTVGQDEDFNIDIKLQLLSVGSISGQVVDAVTGKPLSGLIEPFTSVDLSVCLPNSVCSPFVTTVNSEGRFQFKDRLIIGSPSLDYILRINADQYNEGNIPLSPLQPDENRDLGKLKLTSNPVRFTNKIPCKKIPKQGGSCQYSVRVTNGLATPLDSDLWSIVNINNSSVEFQPKPNQRLALRPGESKKVSFDFPLPSTVDDGTNICANAYIGKRPFPAWNVVGFADLFCMTKGQIGFTVLPEQKAHELTRKSR